jgi:hypothetical protein
MIRRHFAAALETWSFALFGGRSRCQEGPELGDQFYCRLGGTA